jgi:hypothetical protein
MLFHTMDPARSLGNDLDQNSLTPMSVELAVKNLLPWARVEATTGDRHHHLAVVVSTSITQAHPSVVRQPFSVSCLPNNCGKRMARTLGNPEHVQ